MQPPRLDSHDDESADIEEKDFHPCGLTRRGMQQDLEEQAAVTTKEVLQIAEQTAHAPQGEARSIANESAGDDESSDGGSDDDGMESTDRDIGQMKALMVVLMTMACRA